MDIKINVVQRGDPALFPSAPSPAQIKATALRVVKGLQDEFDVADFAKRVRLPGSAAVARLYSRLDAWKRDRVERKAQAAFERGWV